MSDEAKDAAARSSIAPKGKPCDCTDGPNGASSSSTPRNDEQRRIAKSLGWNEECVWEWAQQLERENWKLIEEGADRVADIEGYKRQLVTMQRWNELAELAEAFPELNPNNFDEEDVRRLNDWGIKVYYAFSTPLSATGEKIK